MSRRGVAHKIVDEPPNCREVPLLRLGPGLWRMRNGHTAKIDSRLDIPYKDGRTGEPKTYSIWKGQCVDCQEYMTWTINGRYAAVGRHRNDIVGPA